MTKVDLKSAIGVDTSKFAKNLSIYQSIYLYIYIYIYIIYVYINIYKYTISNNIFKEEIIQWWDNFFFTGKIEL